MSKLWLDGISGCVAVFALREGIRAVSILLTDIAVVFLLSVCCCLLYIVHMQQRINAQQALLNKKYTEHIGSIYHMLSEHFQQHMLETIKEEDFV